MYKYKLNKDLLFDSGTLCPALMVCDFLPPLVSSLVPCNWDMEGMCLYYYTIIDFSKSYCTCSSEERIAELLISMRTTDGEHINVW